MKLKKKSENKGYEWKVVLSVCVWGRMYEPAVD